MTFEPLPPAICSALRELARLANQTDVQITIGHDGRVQLYDFGGELFESAENYAQSVSPDEAAAGLAQALHERSSGWEGWPNATSAGSGRSVDVARYAEPLEWASVRIAANVLNSRIHDDEAAIQRWKNDPERYEELKNRLAAFKRASAVLEAALHNATSAATEGQPS